MAGSHLKPAALVFQKFHIQRVLQGRISSSSIEPLVAFSTKSFFSRFTVLVDSKMVASESKVRKGLSTGGSSWLPEARSQLSYRQYQYSHG